MSRNLACLTQAREHKGNEYLESSGNSLALLLRQPPVPAHVTQPTSGSKGPLLMFIVSHSLKWMLHDIKSMLGVRVQ